MSTVTVTPRQLKRLLSEFPCDDVTARRIDQVEDSGPDNTAWTVSESMAVSDIRDSPSIGRLLETLRSEARQIGVERIRYYSFDHSQPRAILRSVDAIGHSTEVTRKLQDDLIVRELDPARLAGSQSFWCMLYRRPMIFARQSFDAVNIEGNSKYICVFSLKDDLIEDDCIEALKREKADVWLELPLDIGGRPYGKFTCDLERMPKGADAIAGVHRFWSLCLVAAPFLEVMRQERASDHKAPVLDEFQKMSSMELLESHRECSSLTPLLSKLMIFERMMGALRDTWVFAKKRDSKGRIVFAYVNDAFAKQNGQSPEDMIGRPDSEFNQNLEELKQYWEKDSKILDSGGGRVEIEHETWTMPNGEIKHLQTIKEGVTLPNSECWLWGVATDITDKVELESAKNAD